MSGRKQLNRDIVFEDVIYELGATIKAEYHLDAYEANYTWWAASHENWALGPRVGLIWYRFDLGIDLVLDANGNPVVGSIGDDASADLPVPTIGANWRWTPAQDWRISAEAGYFTADINDIDGDVTYGRVGVEWYPWERFGFGLDYTASRIDATVRKTDYNGDFRFTDDGLRLGMTYRF